MLTADQIARNRATLAANIRAQQNLPASPSDWSYSQRVEYNKAFAAYVLAHPASFAAQDAQTAQVVSAEMPQDLEDTSLSADISAFGSALKDEAISAANAIGGVGRGVLTAAKWSAWIIPGGFVILVGILLYKKYKE